MVAMSVELALKVLADGLLFTPKSLIRDIGGLLDLFIYVVRTGSGQLLLWGAAESELLGIPGPRSVSSGPDDN